MNQNISGDLPEATRRAYLRMQTVAGRNRTFEQLIAIELAELQGQREAQHDLDEARARGAASVQDAKYILAWEFSNPIDDKESELNKLLALTPVTVAESEYKTRKVDELRSQIKELERQYAVIFAPAQTPAPVEPASDGPAEWVDSARNRATEIIQRQKNLDLYPNQITIADEIAREFRKSGVVGADGKPLSGATIKRHALKGISSAQGKQLSTTIRRGK